LFANGEQGAWYDPSDMSTMFQDSGGTTPVTASGQPVGLMLDKRLPKGPELISNGDFSSLDFPVGFVAPAGVTAAIVDGRLEVTQTAGGGTGMAYIAIPTVIGQSYQVKFDFLKAGGGRFYIGGSVGAGAQYTSYVLDAQRIYVATSTTTYLSFGEPSNSGNPQRYDNLSFREIPGNHRSQPTTAARPTLMQENGLWYLQPDGVDDFMLTPAFNWGSDKLSWLMGARRLDAVSRGIVEFSANWNTNLGSFFHWANDSGGAWVFGSRGTAAAAGAQIVGFTAPAPDTAIIYTSHDIAGSVSKGRRNGVATVDAAGAKGTGNFGNYPVYHYMRGGVSNPFNGRDYGSIAINRLLSESEMVTAEKWMAAKTGVVL